MSHQVSLHKYSDEYQEALAAFQLPEEQARFTALPVEVLGADAGRHPIVIVGNEIPVGFFVLHTSERVKEYTGNPQAML